MKLSLSANLFAFMVTTPLGITQARLSSNNEKRVLENAIDNDYFAKGKSDDSSQETCGGISFSTYSDYKNNYDDETTGPKCPQVDYYVRSNYLAWEPYLAGCHDDVASGEELTEEFYGGYKNWKHKFHFKFDEEEEECKRLQNWIKRHVSFLKAGKMSKGFSMKHNQNSHLTTNEVNDKYKIGTASPYRGYHQSSSVSTPTRRLDEPNRELSHHYWDLPMEKNWVSEGAITPVKDQGDCGACWAFSAAGAIEFLVYEETGTLEDLSVQEMIDCNTLGYGCSGGIVDCSFSSVGYEKGLCSADKYPQPYNASNDENSNSNSTDRQCLNSCKPVAGSEVVGHFQVEDASESGLMKAVLVQPVSIAIDASSSEFQYYGSGIFDASSCGSKVNHAMLLVGYGANETGAEYWLLKNSWGVNWGEQGYMRLSRESSSSSGPCGIYESPSVPLGKKPTNIPVVNQTQCTGPVVSACEGSNQPGLKVFVQNNLPVGLIATGIYIYTSGTTVSFGGNSYQGNAIVDENNGYFPIASETTNVFSATMSGCNQAMEFAMVLVPSDPEYRTLLSQTSVYVYANTNGTTNAVWSYVEGNYTDYERQQYEQGNGDGQCQACTYESPSSAYGGDYFVQYYCIRPECPQSKSYQCPSDVSLQWNACPLQKTPTTDGDYRYWNTEVAIQEFSIDNQVITVAIFETEKNETETPTTFTNFSGFWKYIGQNIDTMAITRSTSWTTSQETTVSSAYEVSGEASASMSFKEGIFVSAEQEMSASLTASFSKSHSEAVENSKTTSWSITCNTPPCADGNLYQWRQSMSAVKGGVGVGDYYIDYCSFSCVPSMLSTALNTTTNATIGAPKCPATVCSDNTCQCCNQIWKGDDSSAAANYLNQANGGVCSPCNQAGSPCEVDGDCCSQNCINNKISTCGS